VARHSKATKLWVAANKTDDCFVLSITDDGIGFELKDNQEKGSLGLMGMRERALSIGGELQIESSKGKGTIVSFLLRKN
jgi:signal transduction histidine kinase